MKGFYFIPKQPHYLLWPVIAWGFKDETWVCLGWLCFEIGWRSGEKEEA
jgi:hypothetical protein